MPNIKDIMKTAAGWAKNNAYRFDPNINRRTVSWQETKDALREFGESDLGKEVATGLTAAAPAITGGNHMMVGDGLMGLGAVAGAVNPFLGLAVTAGGALMNAAFGSNVNQGAIKGYEDRLVDYSRPEITAQDNTQLLNQINGLKNFGTVKRSDLGTQGWFSHDVDYAYNNLVQGVNAANASRARLVDDAVTNVEKQNDARIAMNYKAFGGPIFGYMNDGAIAYDMARDNLAIKMMNAQGKGKGTVASAFAEGGPTKVHSLLFPRMNEAGEEVAQLQRRAELEAERARQIRREEARRARREKLNRAVNSIRDAFAPDTTTVSPSEVRTMPNSLVFPALNEQVISTGYLANGGLLSDNFTNGVTMINAGGTHEENPYSGVPMGMAEDGQPNLVEEGEAIYKDYVFSNRLKVPKAIRSKYKLRGPKDMTYAEAFLKAQEESKERENDPISKNGLDNIAMILMQSQEEMRARSSSRKKAKGGHLFAGNDPNEPYEGGPDFMDEPGYYYDENGDLVGILPSTTVSPKEEKTGKWNGMSANLLRFAEPAGNMFAVWSDATGRTNNPVTYDFIPNYTPLSFAPIGEYMPELHLDTRYAANQQAQQAAATRNAIMNTTSPSRMASLLAADYNAQNNYGTLLRDAELAEYENLLKARTFNRATNQYNSEMGAKIAEENARQQLAVAQAQLAQAKANTDETNATMGAKAANIKALTTSLANIGRERDAYNWRDMLMRAGVFGTLSEKPTSWSDRQWQAYQDNLKLLQETSSKACGGKLKKKGGFTY